MENATLGYPSIFVDKISFFNSMMEAFNINVDIKNSNISRLIFKAKLTMSKNNLKSTSVTMNNSTLGSIALEGIGNVIFTNSHFKSPKTNQNGILMDISDCHGFMENITMKGVTSNVGFSIVSNSKLSIKKSEFYENKFGNDLIKVYDNSSLLMVDCSLRQNDGHAIRVVDSVVVVMNSLFQNNSATMGGAMHMLNMAELDVLNSVFNHNKAESGGAIYAEDSVSLKIKHSKFHMNNAWQMGGAICAKDHTSVILNNVSFSQNEVGIYTPLGNVNSEGSKGGAIYVDSIENITCKSCSFINNTAIDQGGAFWGIDVENFYIVNTLLIDNIAKTNDGGAIYYNNGKLTMQNCFISNNRARYQGGFLCLLDSTATFSNSTFQRNSAGNEGGAFYFSKSTLSMINVTIKNNSAAKDGYQGGGAGLMAKMKSVININDSQFRHNTAVFGSGGSISSRSGTKINLTRVDVISNHADSFAGGLNLETGSRVILHNCQVNKNSAGGNSGIASIQEGSLLIAKNTTFRENTCAHPDKRLRYHSCVDVGKSEVCYNKVKFENDHAGSDGSVMFTERSKIRISNCTFTSTMSEQREDIFLWDNEGKRLCKLWTYISTFQHNNTVVTSNDPDFKQKAFKESVLRTYSERELNIEEAAYASGKIL